MRRPPPGALSIAEYPLNAVNGGVGPVDGGLRFGAFGFSSVPLPSAALAR